MYVQYSNCLVLSIITSVNNVEHSELEIMLLVKMFFTVFKYGKIPKEINHCVGNMSSTYF